MNFGSSKKGKTPPTSNRMSNNVSGSAVIMMVSDANRNENACIFPVIVVRPRRDRAARTPRGEIVRTARARWVGRHRALWVGRLRGQTAPHSGEIVQRREITGRNSAGTDPGTAVTVPSLAANDRDLAAVTALRFRGIGARKAPRVRAASKAVVTGSAVVTGTAAMTNRDGSVRRRRGRKVTAAAGRDMMTDLSSEAATAVARVARRSAEIGHPLGGIVLRMVAADRSRVGMIVPGSAATVLRLQVTIVRDSAEIARRRGTATARAFPGIAPQAAVDVRHRDAAIVGRARIIRSEAMEGGTPRVDRQTAVDLVAVALLIARNRNRGIVIQGNETGNSRYSRP